MCVYSTKTDMNILFSIRLIRFMLLRYITLWSLRLWIILRITYKIIFHFSRFHLFIHLLSFLPFCVIETLMFFQYKFLVLYREVAPKADCTDLEQISTYRERITNANNKKKNSNKTTAYLAPCFFSLHQALGKQQHRTKNIFHVRSIHCSGRRERLIMESIATNVTCLYRTKLNVKITLKKYTWYL